jgi:hypothetical protein
MPKKVRMHRFSRKQFVSAGGQRRIFLSPGQASSMTNYLGFQMKSKFLTILALIILASAGAVTQASAKENTHARTQQCVGPAGFCTPYFGS